MSGLSPRELAQALVALYDGVAQGLAELPVSGALGEAGPMVEKARAMLERWEEELTNVVSASLPEYGGPRNVHINGVYVVGVRRLVVEHEEGSVSQVTLVMPAKFDGGN